MKWSSAFEILTDLRLAISLALWPTLSDVWRTPSLLWSPKRLMRIFMAHLWIPFGEGVNENAKGEKERLIRPYARGVVLDLGAGHGHTVDYLDRSVVTTYVALEPNELMHTHICTRANKSGYTEDDGSLLILSCGAEEVSLINSALGGAGRGKVDTIISVLTLCTVPNPRETIRVLVRDVLNEKGGQVLYYEHVLSDRSDVAWWQRFWAPIWAMFFDGCMLDRPTHTYLESAIEWKEVNLWGKEGESEENLFWHSAGRLVR